MQIILWEKLDHTIMQSDLKNVVKIGGNIELYLSSNTNRYHSVASCSSIEFKLFFICVITSALYYIIMGRSRPSFDILVKWDSDGSQNVVHARDIRRIDNSYAIGSRVEMWWDPEGRYYQGVIIAVEDASTKAGGSTDEEDDMPLSTLRKTCGHDNIMSKPCSHLGCSNDIFAACVDCWSCLCVLHYNNSPCSEHHESPRNPTIHKVCNTLIDS